MKKIIVILFLGIITLVPEALLAQEQPGITFVVFERENSIKVDSLAKLWNEQITQNFLEFAHIPNVSPEVCIPDTNFWGYPLTYLTSEYRRDKGPLWYIPVKNQDCIKKTGNHGYIYVIYKDGLIVQSTENCYIVDEDNPYVTDFFFKGKLLWTPDKNLFLDHGEIAGLGLVPVQMFRTTE